MFVTPQHQVKELRDEAGRNIVGSTMLCSELGREDWGGGEVYTCRKEQRGEEKREEQEGGGERKGKKRGEEGGKEEVYICIL